MNPQEKALHGAAKSAELAGVPYIKILAMLLVVYCHSISVYMPGGWGPEPPARASAALGLIAGYLNTFHIHTFVAMSGYLFYYLRYETCRYDNPRRVLGNKALRLLLPYVCASVLWVVPFDIRFWGFDPTRIAKDYLLMLNPCQLWFLPMLFIVFCAFIPLAHSARFDKLSARGSALWLFALYIVSVLASAAVSLGAPNVFQFFRALQFLVFFYAGMLLRKFDLTKLYRWKYVLAALLISILLFTATQLLGNAIGLLAYLRLPLRPIVNLAGVGFLALLGQTLARPAGTENGLFRLLNRSMFPVYLFHQQWIYLVIKLLNRTGIAPYWLGEIGFAASLAASLFMAWIFSKWKVTRRMFGIG